MYRCFDAASAEPSCSICGDSGDPRPSCSAGKPFALSSSSNVVGLYGLGVCLACIVMGVCRRQRSSGHGHYHAAVEVPSAYQPPPVFGHPYPQPYAQPYYGQRRQGYSGGTVAASAGAGFLGGLMVGEACGSHGGFGGGDFGGGGGFGGGGDAGFAADS